MIECVTLANSHYFAGNPICEQHRLRYGSIIERQRWDVPTINGMEYDTYDNPAAYYLIKRNAQGQAVGSSRLYPTDRPYMLKETFPHLITKTEIPEDISVWEGSRFCIDSSLHPLERKRITQEIVIGYLEFALKNNIKSIIGVMYPVYWKNIFIKSGWDVEWLGDVHRSNEGYKIIAGNLRVSPSVLNHVRRTTGINQPVLFYGNDYIDNVAAA